MNYTDKDILDRVKSLPSFKGIPNDYWLVAVRNKEDLYNQMDDYVFLYKGEEFITRSSCTTNPGGPALLGGWKKYTKTGAAVIKADEIYYGVYKYGLHNGKMPALRQCGKMKYYRDMNNDKKVDETGKIEEAIFYTNFHFNSYKIFDRIKNTINNFIGEWSYGCIVLNEEDKYEKIIGLTKNQPSVTFCLLKEF